MTMSPYLTQIHYAIAIRGTSQVYKAVDLKTTEVCVIEVTCDRPSFWVLAYARLRNIRGTPRLLWSGWTSEGCIMVLQGLRANLGRLMAICPFFGVTPHICYLAIEMISRIQSVHGAGLVHGDIKPENFALGAIHSSEMLVYILDFGSVFQYTVNATVLPELSQRDDIESLAYTLLDIHAPGLPWWNKKKKKVWNGAEISEDSIFGEKKKFLEDKDYSFVFPVFMAMLRYSRTLEFHARPDYEMLQAMFVPLEEPSEE
ncbi:kinase-like protein [Ramaria rubella]|nr:kinase-like protein [Ramaria rubella]